MTGMTRIRAAAAEVAARKNQGGQFYQDTRLSIEKGATVTVRFLDTAEEIDKQWAWVHLMPPRGKAKYGETMPCIDQDGHGQVDCPACRAELPRRVEGMLNLIWYGGPIYGTKKDDKGNERIDFNNVVGKGDVLAVWTRGVTVLEELDALDQRWKGLNTRDADVSRNKADGFDTKYTIGPHIDEDGNSAPSELSAELKALAATKPDLSKRYAIPSETQMQVAMSGGSPYTKEQREGALSDDPAKVFESIVTASPFTKGKK